MGFINKLFGKKNPASTSSSSSPQSEDLSGPSVKESTARVQTILDRITALDSKEKYLSVSIAKELAEIRDKSALEPLIAALKFNDDAVREKVAEALGEIGDVRAVKPLILALTDDSRLVRQKAAFALGQIGDASAVNALHAAWRKTGTDSDNSRVIVKSLGKIGDRRTIELFLTYISNPIIDTSTASTVIDVLAALGERRAVVPLLNAMKHDNRLIVTGAMAALAQIGDAQAVEPLINCLEGKEAASAAGALGEIGDSRALEPLIQVLKSANDGMRLAAARALGELGDARAVEPLTEALHDPYQALDPFTQKPLSYPIRNAAAEALKKLGKSESWIANQSPAPTADDMLKLKTTVNDSCAAVWDFFTTLEHWREWWGGDLLSIEPGWQNGAVLIWKTGGRSEITMFIPQQEIRTATDVMERIWRFTSLDEKTTQVEMESVPKGGTFFTDGGAAERTQIADTLEKLKQCIENNRRPE